MTCPICGAKGYSLSAAFCTRCGARTVAPEPAARPYSPETTGAHPGYFRPRAFMVTKSPAVAVLLSFLWCGLGQIYNGNIGKGVLLMMLYPICIVISWFGTFALIRAAAATGPDSSAKLLIAVVASSAAPALWIDSMVGAFRTARRINAAARF
jgi:hypothetical protein